MFNRKTIESIDAEIHKLSSEREQLLERRSIILLDIGENPARADVLQAEFNRNDLRLQSIAPTIGKLEGEREALQQKARKAEYTRCKASFDKEYARIQEMSEAYRLVTIRASLEPGQYARMVALQGEVVTGHRQRCLDLLTQLDMTPQEQAAERAAMPLSRDIGVMDVNAHYALREQVLPQILSDLEQRFGIKLTMEAING